MPTHDELPIQPCLECSEPYKVTREDRKFCSDMCRTAYNNRRRKEQPPEQTAASVVDWRPDFYQQINSIIARNRYIMEYLISMDFRAIDRHDLEGYGFNF
ncbi:hypothetical protein [Mucilaginibacter sp. UYCu711]|uniref:hypothetical protein n=1 Tax=Mucilaginibacter sp. UYCu711 TaxID=3156339 RepID=UPI003D23EF5C